MLSITVKELVVLAVGAMKEVWKDTRECKCVILDCRSTDSTDILPYKVLLQSVRRHEYVSVFLETVISPCMAVCQCYYSLEGHTSAQVC